VFAVGLFGLWGIYAFGEPTIRPKKAHPAAQPGEKEPEPADGGELTTEDLVTSLRNATWYHGQITSLAGFLAHDAHRSADCL
jgi:hypothetical protein